MPDPYDPFVHYPELRDRIADPETSFFRTFSVEYLANMVGHFAHLGIVDDHCTELLRAVDAHLAARADREPAR